MTVIKLRESLLYTSKSSIQPFHKKSSWERVGFANWLSWGIMYIGMWGIGNTCVTRELCVSVAIVHVMCSLASWYFQIKLAFQLKHVWRAKRYPWHLAGSRKINANRLGMGPSTRHQRHGVSFILLIIAEKEFHLLWQRKKKWAHFIISGVEPYCRCMYVLDISFFLQLQMENENVSRPWH
jgi:hypothetical protein